MNAPYLPPYSPDFNPIEKAFSKLKALLRKASKRTVEGLWNAIGRLLPDFAPKECANFFKAAGYRIRVQCRGFFADPADRKRLDDLESRLAL